MYRKIKVELNWYAPHIESNDFFQHYTCFYACKIRHIRIEWFGDFIVQNSFCLQPQNQPGIIFYELFCVCKWHKTESGKWEKMV